jgi:cell division protein FtsN
MTSQRGGFALGLIVGLLAGLAIALGLALYVTKVPVPFLNKVPQRTAEQDAAEAERNKQWDPNAPLASPHVARPALRPAPAAPDTAASTTGRTTAAPAESEPAKSTKPDAEAFIYFVQVGAYARPEDAEQQRARVGLMGLSAKISEREQAGRTVYRVRLGPFERKDDADAAQRSLVGNGIEAALMRVGR